MSRFAIIKHVLVFVAAVFLIWLAGVMPVIWPKLSAGGDVGAAFAGISAPTLEGLLGGWPIYIPLAISQALTFHFVNRFTTPLFLVGVFALASLMAWRYWSLVA